jgi:hypothetical protein
LFFFASRAEARVASIGALTWNLGDESMASFQAYDIYEIIQQELQSKDIFVLMLQEAKHHLFDVTNTLRDFGMHMIKKSACSNPFSKTCNRALVFIKGLRPNGRGVLQANDRYWSSLGAIERLDFDESFLNNEKSLVKVSIVLSGHKFCFFGSHFKPKYRVPGEHYAQLLTLMSDTSTGFGKCDTWIWGGDFNARTSGHTGQVKHVDWSPALINAYHSLSIPDDGFFALPNNNIDAFITLQGQLEAKLAAARKALETRSKATYDRLPAHFGETFYQTLPPTFQKAKESACSSRVNVPVTVDAHTNAATVAFPRGGVEQLPICISLHTDTGGNCAAKPGYMCFSMDRPNSYTDQIFFKGATPVNIRGYYGPSPTDHHAVYAEFTVEVDDDIELEELNDDVFEM